MSQPPYGPPPGTPPGPPPGGHPAWTPPPAPRKRRKPRKVWFFVAGAMVLAAPLVFAAALFTVLRPLTQEDAVFAAADGPVQVGLPAGEERAVFTDGTGTPQCTATDGSGADLAMRGVAGDFTYNEWTAVHRFDTGDGEVTLACDATGGERVRVAQLPSTGGFVAGILIGVIGPLLLGGSGLILLVVVSILYATGAPRDPEPA